MYYHQKIKTKLCDHLFKFANTSIDISDGFLQDLQHLSEASEIGFNLDKETIPIAKGILFQDAVKCGDDYQILFTASKSKRKYINMISSKMNQKISIIGQINTKSKNYLLDNRRIPIKYLKYQGYSHIF